jgi:hypothetical protein
MNEFATHRVRTQPGSVWWQRLWRIVRFERGVFTEIAVDGRATVQATAVLLGAALIGGWQFLWPGDGQWHVTSWLLEEGGVALASSAAAAILLWTIARLRGGRGSLLGLWRGIAFSLAPIVLGAFGFAGSLVGGALAVPLITRAVVETQRVRTAVAIAAVGVPVLLYAGFFAFVVFVLGWD